MGLIAELGRRNVIRMAGLYIVGAWLVVQVASTLLPVFEAPAWVMKTVVGLLAVGFVPALVFSWIYELTPEGLKATDEVKSEVSIAPRTAQRMNRMLVGGLVLALAYFALDKFVLAPRRDAALIADVQQASASAEAARAAAAPANSIAVLPFVNLSGEAKHEYLSDGMTEEILNALAQIPGLKVVARTSAFAFKGKGADLREVGETLGVAHVLEGSVQSDGDSVRVTAQLIDAKSGFHVWSEKYDRKLTSVFAIEDEISRAIADKLRAQWGADQPLVRGGTRDPATHALYLRGIAAIAERGAALSRAAELLEEATTRDPEYAAAWAQLSQVYELLPWYELDTWQAGLEKAERAARRALALDPQSAEGHAALANVLRDRFSFDESEREYRRSLELNPGSSEVHNQYGQLLDAIGRFGDAYEHELSASALDPLAANPRYMQGIILDGVRLHADAASTYRKAIEVAPEFLYVYEELAFSLSYAGDHAAVQAAARLAADKTGEDAGTFLALLAGVAEPSRRQRALPLVADVHRLLHKELGSFARAFWYAGMGAREQALSELETWAATSPQGQRFNGLRFLWMPPFDSVREDARFKALLQRFGLPDLAVAALRDSGAMLAHSLQERASPASEPVRM